MEADVNGGQNPIWTVVPMEADDERKNQNCNYKKI